jgi:hypothetical protein
MTNPQGFTPDTAGASEVLLQVWIVGYTFTPNGFININTSCVAISTTQYNLTVTVQQNMALESLAVTAIMVNKTTLLEYSYTQYLDTFYSPMTGNQDITATSDTITDFATQYFFRNTLFGSVGNQITITPALTFFYYNISSLTNSITSSVGLSERSRVCTVS